MQVLAWGNNLTGNLDPKSSEAIIPSPRHILKDLEVEEISWSSWACTIGRVGDSYYIWGSGLPTDSVRVPTKLLLSSLPVKFLGADEPTAYLDQEGFVRTLPDDEKASTSSKAWRDVAFTGLGLVYAVSDNGMYRFNAFNEFMANANPSELSHPVLDPKSGLSLHATESRVFALSKGPLGHTFELDHKGSIKLVEDLEGLGVESITPGSANRFAVITEAGDAYMVNKRTIEPELMEIDDEAGIRFVGVGSKHEVVVTEKNVWVRGENNFSQLGIEGDTREKFVRLSHLDREMVKRIKAVHCGRWSTIIVMHS